MRNDTSKMTFIPQRKTSLIIPENDLLNLYKNHHYSVHKLARYFSCSHTTIANRLRAMGALRQGRRKNEKTISEEDVLRAYRSGNSASFIAKSLGVSRWRILDLLRRQGEAIRDSRKTILIDMEFIQDLYENRHMSVEEISHLLGVNPATITGRLREMGVTLRGNHLQVDMDHLKYLLGQGHSICKIARLMGCSYTAIKSRVNKLNVLPQTPKWRQATSHIVYSYEEQGATLQEIADVYGCSANTIKNILLKEGVTCRKQGRRLRTM